MKLSEITFNRLYQQIIFNLKKQYNSASSSFTLASPKGQILSTITELFQLNMLYTQNVHRSFDMNDALNQNDKTIRALAKIGQYNPSRGQAASGSIKLKLKAGTNIETDISGDKIIFKNRQKLKNVNNNFSYILDINQDELVFSLSNTIPITLNVIQGVYKNKTFTGTGEINQSFVVPAPNQQEIDNFKVNVFVNSELWEPRKHKFDMLQNDKTYVAYTSFSGGVDILFGNGDEGMVPPINSIITVEYLVTEGQEGNLLTNNINDFKFIDFPKDIYNNDIDTSEFFDVEIESKINYGSNGDTTQFLKSIMPYASSNFVLAGPDQYKFFLQRLNVFSIIDVYTSSLNRQKIINDIYVLANKNVDLLDSINTGDNNSTLIQLVQSNLSEIRLLRKMLLGDGGENLVNIFLIPDITIFYGDEKNTNYFNIDLDNFTLDELEKNRILNYLSSEGTQIITNEVKIIDPVIKKYAINVTCRIYDDSVEDNVINEISDKISDYFISSIRRDRIPPSDIIRILDDSNIIDSVTVEYISEDNENYHREYLIKSKEFQVLNKRVPEDSEIIMSDGNTYDAQLTLGLDPILGDILIKKEELPIIRGGFNDRWNNFYNIEPGKGIFSAVNILILPEKTRRNKL